jgi:hypothetical protein
MRRDLEHPDKDFGVKSDGMGPLDDMRWTGA